MSEASATTEGAAAPAPTKAAPAGEARRIALLVGGLMAVGIVAQLFVPPGPVAAVVTASALAAVVIAAALVVRGRLLSTVAGFRLAAVVLLALGAASGLGTVVLQNKPEELYRMKYGPVAGLILALRLDDIFHSLWFAGLLALTIAGLITSAVLRWPINRRNVGFFAVHLGTVLTLAGAGLSALFATKGRVDLRVDGPPASVVAVTHNGAPTGETIPLGASVQLDKFDVDRYREKFRVVLYKPSKERGWEMAASFETERGLEQKLPGGGSFKLEELYPDFAMSERVVPVESNGAPALSVTFDGKESWLMPGGKLRADSADGKVAVLFGWKRPEIPAGSPVHTLTADGKAQPIKIGDTLALADGTAVKALRFLPHFTYDIEKKEAYSLSQRPINPALEVQIGGEEGPKKWLFARMPGHDHNKGGPQLAYAYTPGGISAETVIAVSGSEKNALVRRGDKEETVALAEGLEIEGARFGPLYAQAKLEREAGSLSTDMKNPAVRLQVTDAGKTRESLLVARKQDGFRLSNGNVLTYESRGDEVKSFRSHVSIFDGKDKREAVVAVNDPVSIGKWMLYQVNYDPKDPKYSGLEAVRDPGVNWVFAGFGFMFLGVVYMIYVAPRLRRREA